MGCPVTYDCLNISWARGKLSKLSCGDKLSGTKTYNYNYNALGQRTSRSYTYSLPMLDASAVAMGTPTGYGQTFCYDQSGRLIREGKSSEYYGEEGSSDSIVYLYDANSIIGMVYTADGATNTYYFQRNLLGDVIGIYDTSGAKVGGYAYDAWGNCTITLNTNGIATRNPIRYRGYYYDADTNLYYLNARYYSPELRRFISPDDTAYLDPETPNGLNLYCYCNNDPVNNIDPSGHEWYNPLTWDWGEIAKGVGLIITGVGAIAVGVVTLPYGGWISAVAGITILAGGGTALFGLSDVGEGITDYNVIQETVFMGNENAYNLTENIFMYTAIAGTAICGLYGATHTTFSSARSTPRTGNPHSGHYNRKFNTLTYYGKNGEMKYSMHLFNKGHQWIHWHTELPHSKPINNFFKFVWKMLSGGV